MKALEPAGAEMAVLDSIHQQEHLAFIAKLAQPEQVLGSRGGDSPLPLDALNQHRDRGRGNGIPHRLQIVVGDMLETGHRRLEPLLDLVLPCSGNPRQGPAMEGVQGGDDFKPALVMPEFARDLVKALIRLGTAVAEEDFPGSNQRNDVLRQTPLGLVVIEVRDVHQFSGLLDQGVGDRRGRMPKRVHSNASPEVRVTPSCDVPHIRTCPVAQNQIKAAVARNHILLEQTLYRRHIISHDGRRCWNDFFHAMPVKRKTKSLTKPRGV